MLQLGDGGAMSLSKTNMVYSMDKHLSKFASKTKHIEYRSKGIWKNEAFIICALSKIFKTSYMLESGFCQGVSTELMCSFCDHDVITFDICPDKYVERINVAVKRLGKYDNFNFVRGDSKKLLVSKAVSLKGNNIGVFIDGPKGSDAIKLAKKCYELENVKFVAIHDLKVSDKKRLKFAKNIFHSHDKHLIKYVEILSDKEKLHKSGDSKLYSDIMPIGPGMMFFWK